MLVHICHDPMNTYCTPTSVVETEQGLSRRGLHATALEVAKLLLALDPRDPMGERTFTNALTVSAHNTYEHSYLPSLTASDPLGRFVFAARGIALVP